jgi:uncharacterized NAD(P)/FAD-binding protein YdhS
LKDILIVGGGASGILVAIHLAKQANSPIAVRIAEPSLMIGRGVAYSTNDDGHLLNVPAGRMSAFSSDPSHFTSWARCEENDFISRHRYGRYLLETFIQSQSENGMVSFVHERVKILDIEKIEGQFLATSESGPFGKFDAVVLALGNGSSNSIPVENSVVESDKYIGDPWRDHVPNVNGQMICIGTGLTFLDIALSHLKRSNKNTVVGISRNGELPKAHLAVRSAPLPVPQSAKISPTSLRQYIERSKDWRAAQDGVRHELPSIWFGWSETYKHEFWNVHLRWWNVHRHRIAPEIATEVEEYQNQGRLKIVSGKPSLVKTQSDGIGVYGKEFGWLQGDIVVNATGYLSINSNPLQQSVIVRKLANNGPLNFGFKTNFPEFELIGENGEVTHGLYGLGPILIGERLETTAVPEIREQAELIATALLNS